MSVKERKTFQWKQISVESIVGMTADEIVEKYANLIFIHSWIKSLSETYVHDERLSVLESELSKRID